MTSVSIQTAATSLLSAATPPRIPTDLAAGDARPTSAGRGDELRERFTQFVGETFYGQMIKSMRSTVGKPAYFHGGRGEEVFRAQLDQTLSQHMTAATADRFADPMFQRQFPHLAGG